MQQPTHEGREHHFLVDIVYLHFLLVETGDVISQRLLRLLNIE